MIQFTKENDLFDRNELNNYPSLLIFMYGASPTNCSVCSTYLEIQVQVRIHDSGMDAEIQSLRCSLLRRLGYAVPYIPLYNVLYVFKARQDR